MVAAHASGHRTRLTSTVAGRPLGVSFFFAKKTRIRPSNCFCKRNHTIKNMNARYPKYSGAVTFGGNYANSPFFCEQRGRDIRTKQKLNVFVQTDKNRKKSLVGLYNRPLFCYNTTQTKIIRKRQQKMEEKNISWYSQRKNFFV